MDLRQLNVLVAIAEHGSFSAAADALETVQSNVSTHIKKLETELDCVLIDRATGELTEVGVLAVERARRVIDELDALSSDVAALSREVVGTVRLGLIGTAALWIVPQLLDLLPTMHPHLHLSFREATTLGLDAELACGEIELAVLALVPTGSEIHNVALFEEDLGLFLPRTHPLADRPSLTVADLATVPLLLPIVGTNFRATLDVIAAAVGVTFAPTPRSTASGSRARSCSRTAASPSCRRARCRRGAGRPGWWCRSRASRPVSSASRNAGARCREPPCGPCSRC